MSQEKRNRLMVRRDHADTYVLISLVSFAATVIITRALLELTGYPQIGNSVLHIAHALWGGLLLIVAAYLPLMFANRCALQASAVLGGVGIGLFIDEVGKFITQANDYFFAPALPLIYGFVLLDVLVYLYFRRPRKEDARAAMNTALEGLRELLDGDLDAAEVTRIEAQLAIAQRSEQAEIASLAKRLSDYLQNEIGHLPAATPGIWKRITLWMETVGRRIGRSRHRAAIAVILIGWAVLVAGYLVVMVQGVPNLDSQVLQWRGPLIGIQIVVGLLLIVAALFWLIQKEELGLKFGVSAFLFSLVALQLLYFYLSQFSAITATLLQLAFLQVLLAYQRRYLRS